MTEPQVPVSLSELKTILFLVSIPPLKYEGNQDRYVALYKRLKARVEDAELEMLTQVSRPHSNKLLCPECGHCRDCPGSGVPGCSVNHDDGVGDPINDGADRDIMELQRPALIKKFLEDDENAGPFEDD